MTFWNVAAVIKDDKLNNLLREGKNTQTRGRVELDKEVRTRSLERFISGSPHGPKFDCSSVRHTRVKMLRYEQNG